MMIPTAVRRGLWLALALAFVVVVAGAFVRLSDAGLGCPDWPECYGVLIGIGDAQSAGALYPHSEYDIGKARIEVGHRYIAGVLGLLLLGVAVADWRARRRWALPQWLVVAVVFQAVLGGLTVTQLLQPVIVSAHLLGGMLILFLLAAAVTAAGQKPLTATAISRRQHRRLRRWAAVAAAVLFVQIFLGGWVSSNYAGLACPDFPACQGGWLPPTVDFSGFELNRELHQNSSGNPISAAALATIHWTHRLGALVLTVVFAAFAVALWQSGAHRAAVTLAVLVSAQIIVGIYNVAAQLPLPAAVAHNALAAVLVVHNAVLSAKIYRPVTDGKTGAT